MSLQIPNRDATKRAVEAFQKHHGGKAAARAALRGTIKKVRTWLKSPEMQAKFAEARRNMDLTDQIFSRCGVPYIDDICERCIIAAYMLNIDVDNLTLPDIADRIYAWDAAERHKAKLVANAIRSQDKTSKQIESIKIESNRGGRQRNPLIDPACNLVHQMKNITPGIGWDDLYSAVKNEWPHIQFGKQSLERYYSAWKKEIQPDLTNHPV
jgi:hypothetical protein